MPREVYLPDSDCECYYQALDLLNDALEPIDERITALEQSAPDPQYSGVSTEPKPSDVAENSIYLELDTGKFYYYHDNEWHELPCSCSGDGGQKILYLNKWINEKFCEASETGIYPTMSDLTALIDEGYTLYYKDELHDNNTYWSTGEYDDDEIYFTSGSECGTTAIVDNELHFDIIGVPDVYIRQHVLAVKTDVSQSELDSISFTDYITSGSDPSKSDIVGILYTPSNYGYTSVEELENINNLLHYNTIIIISDDNGGPAHVISSYFDSHASNGRPYLVIDGKLYYQPASGNYYYIQYATINEPPEKHIALLMKPPVT